MISYFILVLSATIFFLSSCQALKSKKWTSNDLIINDDADLSFAEELTSKQVAEDIEFLIFALTKGYGGRQYVPKDFFADAIKNLRKISKTSQMEGLHEQIDESLLLIPDNHLMAYYKGKTSKRRQALEANGKVGKNKINNPKRVWEVRIEKVGNKRVLYISITSFPHRQSHIWNGFIFSVASKLKKSDSVILDLRGNSGGDDTIGMELAKLFFGGPFEHPIKRQYRSQTPETLALKLTKHKVEIINMKHQGIQIPSYLIESLTESQDFYNKALKSELPSEYIRTDKGAGSRANTTTEYTKPIYVLMDRECASSCEFTVAAFEWHRHVKKIGENTNGTFHFSNSGMVVLPNSKIKEIIPTQYSEYYDSRFIERVGLSPDIKLSAGEDAYEFARKTISAD